MWAAFLRSARWCLLALRNPRSVHKHGLGVDLTNATSPHNECYLREADPGEAKLSICFGSKPALLIEVSLDRVACGRARLLRTAGATILLPKSKSTLSYFYECFCASS